MPPATCRASVRRWYVYFPQSCRESRPRDHTPYNAPTYSMYVRCMSTHHARSSVLEQMAVLCTERSLLWRHEHSSRTEAYRDFRGLSVSRYRFRGTCYDMVASEFSGIPRLRCSLPLTRIIMIFAKNRRVTRCPTVEFVKHKVVFKQES